MSTSSFSLTNNASRWNNFVSAPVAACPFWMLWVAKQSFFSCFKFFWRKHKQKKWDLHTRHEREWCAPADNANQPEIFCCSVIFHGLGYLLSPTYICRDICVDWYLWLILRMMFVSRGWQTGVSGRGLSEWDALISCMSDSNIFYLHSNDYQYFTCSFLASHSHALIFPVIKSNLKLCQNPLSRDLTYWQIHGQIERITLFTSCMHILIPYHAYLYA